MTTTTRVAANGRGLRIDVDVGASVTAGSGDVSIRVEEGPDSAVIVSRYLSGRAMAKRRGVQRIRPGVTPEMEFAAAHAALAGADVGRLGGSLAAVYEAMEAARLGVDDEE